MITDMRTTRDAVVSFVVRNPVRRFTARELAGELVGLEVKVKEVLEDLVAEGLLVKDGENYRRPVHGEENS